MNDNAHAPYADPAADAIYNGLFCDQPLAFTPRAGQGAAPWQQLLASPQATPAQVRALADGDGHDARVRALAFGWLRRHGHAVPPRQLLGAVIEVPIDGGLDTLAAYTDGSVRYLNHTGRVSIFEGPLPPLLPAVQRLLAASLAVVQRIGPSDSPRRAPPQQNLRMSFVVSDGLYFGEGPMAALQADPMAGPVLAAAIELLQRVVAMAAPQPEAA